MDSKLQVSAKMTSKNQITIPKSIREKLGLKKNQRVIFEFTSDGEIKITSEKNVPTFDDFWKTERTIVEKNGKYDTEEFLFENDLGEEKIEW